MNIYYFMTLFEILCVFSLFFLYTSYHCIGNYWIAYNEVSKWCSVISWHSLIHFSIYQTMNKCHGVPPWETSYQIFCFWLVYSFSSFFPPSSSTAPVHNSSVDRYTHLFLILLSSSPRVLLVLLSWNSCLYCFLVIAWGIALRVSWHRCKLITPL